MSYGYDDNDDEQQNGGALRAQLEKALKDLKARDEEIAKLSASVKTVTLDNILRDEKIPPHIQRWIKRDSVEPTAEAVKQWVAENGADFGYKPGEQETAAAKPSEGQSASATEAPTEPAVPSVLTPEDVAQLERIQGLLAGGTGQSVYSDAAETAVKTVESQLGPNASMEDVVAALAAQGVPIERSY